jgi:hypothetical protein
VICQSSSGFGADPRQIPRLAGENASLRDDARKKEGLTAFSLIAAQRHASTGGVRDQAFLFVEDVALGEADGASLFDDSSFCAKFSFPDRFQEIDFEFERGERFVGRDVGGVRESHGRVGDVAENASVERADGVGVMRADVEFDSDPARAHGGDVESEVLGDGKEGRRFSKASADLFEFGSGLAG